MHSFGCNKKANTATIAPTPDLVVPVVPAVPLHEDTKN